jgi:hypothetical protein
LILKDLSLIFIPSRSRRAAVVLNRRQKLAPEIRPKTIRRFLGSHIRTLQQNNVDRIAEKFVN